MVCKLFKYSNGYNYDEFSHMCDRFKHIHLPFFENYDVNRVIAEYIFGYSMRRFPVGLKSTVRRFLGGMFLYPLKKNGDGDTAFVFTGDGIERPDYIKGINKVMHQNGENTLLVTVDRTKPQFCIMNIFSVILETIWAFKINQIVHEFNISFDMAISLYRARKQGEYIFKEVGKCKKIVTFCDSWSIESIITQLALQKDILTATLQHGNGTEILYGTCSDYYLANSRLSAVNCGYAGINKEKIILAGPMKYAGEKFEYKKINEIKRIGVVFDGAHNFENNVEMLTAVHHAIEKKGVQCCIRFHPNNKREDYQSYLREFDVVYENLEEFERDIDVCIVYNSSMYTDMIYKHIFVIRFKNGKVDLFPELNDSGFSTGKELADWLSQINDRHIEFVQAQEMLYKKVFGEECTADSYKNFLK